MNEHRTSNIEHRTPKEGVATSARASSNGTDKRKFDLEERMLNFASAIIDISEALPKTRSGNHIAGQLLRSGTSPYSNHGEAEAAESADDFLHKLRICLKELRETRRWLRLVQRKTWLAENSPLSFALLESDELIRIFVASIRTASRNRDQLHAPKPVNNPSHPTSS